MMPSLLVRFWEALSRNHGRDLLSLWARNTSEKSFKRQAANLFQGRPGDGRSLRRIQDGGVYYR